MCPYDLWVKKKLSLSLRELDLRELDLREPINGLILRIG
jgi:hypothetical protein